MQDYIYSAMAFLAIVIHLIINFDMLLWRKVSATRGAREYQGFLAGVFFYYIVDACWGVFAGLEWTRVLYLDTMVYYIAIAVSVLTLCRFVIAYLGVSGWRSRLLFLFGYMLLALYVVLLAANLSHARFSSIQKTTRICHELARMPLGVSSKTFFVRDSEKAPMLTSEAKRRDPPYSNLSVTRSAETPETVTLFPAPSE